MTGATGFVGAYLFKELIKTQRSHIICLVRARDDQHATARMQSVLAFYKIHVPGSRWSAFRCDITQERCGLNEELYASVAATTAVVFHAAAVVNSALPFQALKAANVDGVLRVTQLCIDADAILQHVSTLVSPIPVCGLWCAALRCGC